MNTIAINFDGVIHQYSKGWHDGSIYDRPVTGSFETIRELMEKGFSVFILSTRSPWQIKKWLDKELWFWDPMYSVERKKEFEGSDTDKNYIYGFDSEVIWQPWVKFWNKKKVLGITNKKLPAISYIDDRAHKFTNWNEVLKSV